MANIIENFNENQLDLIIENTTSYTYDESIGDYIRMTVFDETDKAIYQFYSNKTVVGNYASADDSDRQIIVYNNDNNIYVKPNEILDINGVVSGNYKLQFDFMRDYFYSHYNMTSFTDLGDIMPQFYVHQISPTRKEIRLYGRIINNESVPFDDEFQMNFQKILGWVDERNKLPDEDDFTHQQFLYDYFVSASGGRNLQIINYAFDPLSNPGEISLVIRLNKALPSDVTLFKKIAINKEIISTQSENIIYNSEIESIVATTPLTPDVEVYDELNVSTYDDTPQNYDQLITSSSTSEINLTSILAENKNINLNVDFNYFKNHTFFGSAKAKLVNFKNKVGEIQNYLTEISSSLNLSGSYINNRRKELFNAIQTVQNNFTPYEKFLYRDGQTESSASAPGVGKNLVSSTPVNKDNLYKKLSNYDGFNVVYHHSGSNDEVVKLFDDKYFADKSPFFNYSGSVYLSFLMRTDQAITGSSTNVLQWKNNNSLRNTIPVPSESLYQSRISEPSVSGSNWRRYIYQASQSYWTPSALADNDVGTINLYNMWDGFNGVAYHILQDNSITGSMAILDSSGQYGELIQPTILDSDGNIDTNIPRTGSVLPSGEYFKINWTAGTAVTSSFITDIKVTKNNPSDALPFSLIYNTGSTEWNTWYNGMHTSASQFDEYNINSLENNLPSFMQESTEYDDAKLFLKMWGEHFDLLKIYIDNFIKFYKREYKEVNSVPSNLLPILGDNLGWEFINPYTGSLAEYFEIVSDGGDNLENVKHETWRKVLNNLIYIYKTKGTHNSINALLNAYGFPTNLFRLQEIGGSVQSPTLTTTLSDQINNLINGLDAETGDLSYVARPQDFYSLNFNSSGSAIDSSQVKLDWWSNDANGEAIQFVLKAKPSNDDQIILLNSGSGNEKMWDLRLVPSSSNTQHAKLEFRLNNATIPTGSLSNNAVSMSTGYLQNLSNNKLWNVLLQRMTSSLNANVTQSYQMLVGLQDGDKIKKYNVSSMSLNAPHSTAHSASNFNFISNGSTAISGNLILGRTLSGSIGEFRVWDEALSGSRFKQHILSKQSIVGNTLNSSDNDLIYRFRFNENYNRNSNNVKIIDSSPNATKDYSRYLYVNPIQYSIDRITSYKFSNVDNYTNNPNDNKIIIKPEEYMYRSLEYDTKSVKRFTDRNVNRIHNSNKIIFSQNPIDVVDDYIINKISDHDASEKFSKPSNRFSSSYGELDEFRDKVLKDVKIDINKNIEAHKNKLPDGLTQGVKKLVPLRTEFDNVGVIIRPNILERSKIKYYKSKLLGGSPEEQALEMNKFDAVLDMLDYFHMSSGSSYEQPYDNDTPIVLEDYLMASFSEIFNANSMNLSLVSGSFGLKESAYISPYESNNIYVSGSFYNWKMEKVNPHESNELNASGSVYNWSIEKVSTPEDTIDYGGLFNLNSTQDSPNQTNELNASGSVYNWNIDVKTPYESNTINASGSAYNWLYEIVSAHNFDIHLTSGSMGKFKIKNPEVYLPYDSNNVDVSGSLYNWNMKHTKPHESNEVNVSGSLYNWLIDLFEPYDSNYINIATGSTATFKVNSNTFTTYDSDLKVSGSVYNWNIENSVPYESNEVNVSGSLYNWLYEIFSPIESNILELVSGSNAVFKFKNPEIYTPYESNNVDVSGSLYSWDMENVTTYDSNIISWEDEIYKLTKDYVKPFISNKISLTSGSYHKINEELFTTKDGSVNVSGSVYNWSIKKTSPHECTLHYSGSVYNWTMEHIPDTRYFGTITEIRDNFGFWGSRYGGGVFNPDEPIHKGTGHPGSITSSQQPVFIKNWLEAYGTGSDSLHFWSPMTGSDGTHNTGHYERQVIFYPFGDMEHVSCSVFKDGLVDIAGTDTLLISRGKSRDFRKFARKHLRNTPAEIFFRSGIRENTDLTDTKHFPYPPLMVDKGKGYTYKSYRKVPASSGSSDSVRADGLMDGRPIGRTHYFSTSSLQSGAVKGQEDLVYPINHYVYCPTSKVGLRHLTYDGTQWVSGSYSLKDPRGSLHDPFPSTPAYSIRVEGSRVHGSRILKAQRNKGKDSKRK